MNAWNLQRRGLPGLMLTVVMVASNPALAQETSETQELEPDGRALTGQVRAGLEYDDNALRVGGEARQSDALLRYFASIDGAMRSGEDGRLSLLVRHGGKRFWTQTVANTLLTQTAARYAHRAAPWLTLGAGLDLKDRTSEVDLENPPPDVGLFDYTSGGAGVDLDVNGAWYGATLGGSWRIFSFKPNEAASSNGPSLQASVRVLPADAVTITAGYTLLSRRFASRRFVLVEPPNMTMTGGAPTVTLGTQAREDIFHVGRAALSWRGPVILDVGYNLSLNRSNSFGQDLTRQNLEVTLTAPLFWELLASGYLQLQRTSYDNPIFVDANFQIDEDNRNSLVASLSRPLGDDWEVELRYSLYTQEFGGPTEYSRQTLMLALGYNFER